MAPAAGDVHLALTELYLDRGWRTAAADKLVLLGRLTDLAADDLTRARLCTMAAERFPRGRSADRLLRLSAEAEATMPDATLGPR